MLTEDIPARVRALIGEHLGADAEKIADDKCMLVDDLGADSLDAVELGISCEEEFGVDLPDDEIGRLVTVGDVIALVEKWQRRAGAPT